MRGDLSQVYKSPKTSNSPKDIFPSTEYTTQIEGEDKGVDNAAENFLKSGDLQDRNVCISPSSPVLKIFPDNFVGEIRM